MPDRLLQSEVIDSPQSLPSATDKGVIDVSDNSIGIAPKYSERIFEILSRLRSQQAYPGNWFTVVVLPHVPTPASP